MENVENLKRLKAFWRQNFGDADEYVNLIYDNYYKPEFSLYEAENKDIISALLGIGYDFHCNKAETPVLRGLYLCGLSTLKECRGKGIMSKLIEKINQKAKNLGYDFTFLIPADDGLRRYYSDRGYVDAFYRIEEWYAPLHDFLGNYKKKFEKNNNCHGLRFKDVSDCQFYDYNQWLSINQKNGVKKEEIRSKFIEFLMRQESSFDDKEPLKNDFFYRLIHSEFDWQKVLEENSISGDKVFILTSFGVICCVAFITENNCHKDRKTIEVKRILSSDPFYEAIILSKISAFYPNYSIKNERQIKPEDFLNPMQKKVWEPFFAKGSVPSGEYEDVSTVEEVITPVAFAKPFGMCRILNVQNLIQKLGFDLLPQSDCLTEGEMKHLVLRKPVSAENPVSSLFNLPNLILSMSLMLE